MALYLVCNFYFLNVRNRYSYNKSINKSSTESGVKQMRWIERQTASTTSYLLDSENKHIQLPELTSRQSAVTTTLSPIPEQERIDRFPI